MKIKKEQLGTLWYENSEGEKFFPDMTQGFESPPEGFIYQHSRFPTNVSENVLQLVSQEEVDACDHPSEFIIPTYGWVDGVIGRRCTLCAGTQLVEKRYQVFLPGGWPLKWDAPGSKHLITMNSSYPADLVLAMANAGAYTLEEAMIVGSQACERCMNALAYQYGLEWGYAYKSDEWNKCNTICDFCREDPLPRKQVYISYIGWESDTSYKYCWEVLPYNQAIKNGNDLQTITTTLEKQFKFKKVIIVSWKRMEE